MRIPDDCCVRPLDLPLSVHAMVVIDESGFANIYVNSRLTREAQARAIAHEIQHIIGDDAYSDKLIQEIEG